MKLHARLEEPLELVAVGHLTVDRASGDRRLGGAAAYAAIAGARLGFAVGVVTSVGDDFPFWGALDAIEVHVRPAERTTEFENLYDGGKRSQRVLARAAPLDGESVASIRPRLSEDAAVLYCPVVQELEMPLVPLAPRGLCGVAPQGFFRRWDSDGKVAEADWKVAAERLGGADFVSMSESDHPAPEELAEGFRGRAFAITKGARGVRVYAGADVFDFPAVPAREIDPTGAGDVFAAVFLLALREGEPVPSAARLATAAAARSVEGRGVEAIPTRAEVGALLDGGGP